jgi:hypothetical protein
MNENNEKKRKMKKKKKMETGKHYSVFMWRQNH